MNNHHPGDMFYDQNPSRSPGSQRHQQQTLHNQPSRQFDAYGHMPNHSMYAPEDQTLRYDTNRYDRTVPPVPGAGFGYEIPGAQTWNPNAFGGGNNYPALNNPTGRMRSQNRGRSALPPTWLDPQQMSAAGPFGGIGPSPLGQPQMRNDHFPQDPDDELIPTAIVIKNIPFAVKKEQLVELMNQMQLPLPYAFNYHFDNGVFRGLAFANFTNAEETAAVIDHLNHFELHGRKLRVEYKKMLPIQERERIEREKRERRGQLEEQHRPVHSSTLHTQPSMSSMNSRVAHSPSPLSQHPEKPDMNDAQTLEYYSMLILFKGDTSRDRYVFPTNLIPSQRRIVHTLAHHLGLDHHSIGDGDHRQIHVTKTEGDSPPLHHLSAMHSGELPRGRALNRAATQDFNEARGAEPQLYNSTLRGQHSTGYLAVTEPASGFGAQQNLRAAKSFADLRSYSVSPALSAASFPLNLQANVTRFQENYNAGSASTTTPTLTPTASAGTLGQNRDETSHLINGFGGMTLGGSNLGPNGGSPRILRNVWSYDQDIQPTSQRNNNPGPIGGHRSFSTNFEDQSRDRGNQGFPMRQPRGPHTERGGGFTSRRQNGHQARGSNELKESLNPDIIAE